MKKSKMFRNLLLAGAVFAGAAWAEGIGASLLTQQHPFYSEIIIKSK